MCCRCVGNSVEVEESLQCLRGGGARDLRDLVVLQVRYHAVILYCTVLQYVDTL